VVLRARYCAACRHDFLVAFRCKGRDICPSYATRRMVETAGPAGATLQLLQEAQQKMGLGDDPNDTGGTADGDGSKGRVCHAVTRCRAMLLARIYECLPLLSPACGGPMRIIAFVLERPVIEQILGHIGEPSTPPAV